MFEGQYLKNNFEFVIFIDIDIHFFFIGARQKQKPPKDYGGAMNEITILRRRKIYDKRLRYSLSITRMLLEIYIPLYIAKKLKNEPIRQNGKKRRCYIQAQ